MGKENKQPFSKAVRDCLEQVKLLKAQTEPLVERIKNDDLKEDFIEKVRKFLVDFDDLKEAFERMPLEDGVVQEKMPERELRESLDLFPELIRGVEGLAADQATIMAELKKNMQSNSDQMKIMRKAKKIFDKFVKAPKQEARFFDVQG
jgi:hypothetical protein